MISSAKLKCIDFYRLNITKTVRKYSINPNLIPTGAEFNPGPIPRVDNYGDEGEGEFGEGSVPLTGASFDNFSRQFPVLVVNFYAPWCPWSNCLEPSWEKASKVIRNRYDPELDRRILRSKVDYTQ
ncbi:protein disulfide isomerase-like 5-4 [Aristolochia californica]|uniref:protein disulfide isomerase-like 5-4 n=1 Tax=Aristolochia californica TaxID=171875 RepID=UPI0035D586B3